MLNRLFRNVRSASMKNRRADLRLETLESREVPAVLIQIDYSQDTGFFANNPDARAVMERVATDLGNSLSANLNAITPGGSNTWNATFFSPTTGSQVSLSNLTIGANTIKVFVGGRAIGGSEAGYGGTGGYGISGTQAWINSIQNRGNGGMSTWGGSIAFDTTQNWFYGLTTAGLTRSKLDFYSVATHELGHVLGIGTSSQWNSLSYGGSFHGGHAMSVYGGAVPLSPDGAHWADGTTVNGQPVSLDPTLPYGQRVTWSSLDAAALLDLGWGGGGGAPSAPANPPAAVILAGSVTGTVSTYVASSTGLNPTGAQFTPFPGYKGEIRVAAGDFNGDGVTDYAFTTGAGVQSTLEIVNGRDGSMLVGPTVLFPGYTGGFSIAAGDIDHDGKAELVIAVSSGAPPLVQTYRVGAGGLQLESSFIAFNAPWFSGGLRVAVGDINRDGFADVVVTTASILGAVGVYSGADLRSGQATYLIVPFIPLLGTPYGLNAAVGDMDGDGYADLALTFEKGPGIVAVWSGKVLSENPNTPANQLPFMGAFYALAPNDMEGARLAMEDLDGDGRKELIVTSANKLNSVVRVFNISQVVNNGVGGATVYPLGTTTVSGIYAADHATTSDTNSDTPPPVDAPTNKDQTYTVTAAPVLHKCTCPACTGLSRSLGSVGGGSPLVSAIPVA